MAPVRRRDKRDGRLPVAPLRERLGRYLVAGGVITETQRSAALARQREEGGLFGQILVTEGVCSREDIGAALKQQGPITGVDLRQVTIDPAALKLVTRDGCLENRFLPFERFGSLLCLAMANARDRGTVLTIKNAIDIPVKPFWADWNQIVAAIEAHYGR